MEFYDTRVRPTADARRKTLTISIQACEEAHDRLRHQGLQDGVMEIVFAAQEEDQRGASPR